MNDMAQPLQLVDGHAMPRLGLGVYKSPTGDATCNAVQWALEAGYRHIDTAAFYGNEESVGVGVRASGIARDDLFITTKVWNDDIRAHRVREAFELSLQRLDMEYIDLYLIHWPVDGYQDAWRELERLHDEGLIRSIGVSNFNPHHIEELERTARMQPAVNQIESHPCFGNRQVAEWCRVHNIAVTAWRPLGGGSGSASVLGDSVIEDIAAAHTRTPAQVVIRWHLQHGVAVIPKSVHEDRIRQNAAVFDFALSDADMARIDALETGARMGADPDNVPF